jgi:filamentous hemagglutinin family protein
VLAGARSQQGNTTTIRAIDKTIIKYDRFNIPKGGTVCAPSNSSTVLNRINSAEPSRIEGISRPTASSLLNPAGVMFGPTAVIDGQLYAGV